MRYIVGPLSLLLTCVALSTLAVAVTSIEGSWIGSGTVSHRSNVDRVQCRVRYTKSSEKTYATSSVCTTENGRYEVSGHVTNIGGNRYQGARACYRRTCSPLSRRRDSMCKWDGCGLDAARSGEYGSNSALRRSDCSDLGIGGDLGGNTLRSASVHRHYCGRPVHLPHEQDAVQRPQQI